MGARGIAPEIMTTIIMAIVIAIIVTAIVPVEIPMVAIMAIGMTIMPGAVITAGVSISLIIAAIIGVASDLTVFLPVLISTISPSVGTAVLALFDAAIVTPFCAPVLALFDAAIITPFCAPVLALFKATIVPAFYATLTAPQFASISRRLNTGLLWAHFGAAAITPIKASLTISFAACIVITPPFGAIAAIILGKLRSTIALIIVRISQRREGADR
jgi:hypothetical protein